MLQKKVLNNLLTRNLVLINLSQEQEVSVVKKLQVGWFWDVVFFVRKHALCSFQEAYKYVEEKASKL